MKRLGYLSGAPRVSTRPEAEASGPRAHLLGVVRAFETLGWEVSPFITGDRVPREWVIQGSEEALGRGVLRRLSADIIRLSLGLLNARRSWNELKDRVDWVYERFTVFQAIGWVFKRHGMPWILETNAPLFKEARNERKSIVLSRVARFLELWAYRKCDVLVCVSAELKEIIVREAGMAPDKILVVPNGVDTVFFDPLKHEPERVFEGFTLVFAGSFITWQGIDLLLEAMADLSSEGIDIFLVLIGDGPMKKTWQTKAEMLGLTERLKNIGRVPPDQVPRYHAGADIGFSGQVRFADGSMYLSPLKLYEYMAMAKPVVASAFEDARNLVREGETGFLFTPGDKESLKLALRKAYHSRDDLAIMGQRARKLVNDEHSWDSRVKCIIQGVEWIVSGRR